MYIFQGSKVVSFLAYDYQVGGCRGSVVETTTDQNCLNVQRGLHQAIYLVRKTEERVPVEQSKKQRCFRPVPLWDRVYGKVPEGRYRKGSVVKST